VVVPAELDRRDEPSGAAGQLCANEVVPLEELQEGTWWLLCLEEMRGVGTSVWRELVEELLIVYAKAWFQVSQKSDSRPGYSMWFADLISRIHDPETPIHRLPCG
jgi:hypothetical protein